MAASSKTDSGETLGSTNRLEVTRAYQMLALISGLFIVHAIYLACIAEDAHITFRFARHLAEGNGFTWNVNEPPIEGFTSFLWVLVSALGLKAGLDIFLLTQFLGVFAALGTLWLTFAIARQFMGASFWSALVPCALLAVSGPLATWATSGMEMSTFGFFILLGVYGYLTFLHGGTRRWLFASGITLCIATLLRPEGAMIFVVLAGLSVTVFNARTRATLGTHFVWAVLYTLPLVVFVVWRLQVFGDPLPNTFYQKTGGGFWQHARGAGYLVYFAFFYITPLLLFPMLLIWEAGLPKVRPLLQLKTWIRWISEQKALVVVGVICLAYFSYMVYSGGDYMAMYRFMVPVLPFLYLVFVPIVEPLRRITLEMAHKASLLGIVVVIAAAGSLIHSLPIEQSFFRKATWQHGNYRGVKAERSFVARFELIGRFFDGYGEGEGRALATRSIGAIGFYAKDFAIHDLSGLTDRHISRVPVIASPHGWAGHEKWDLDYSFGRLPTYFMLDERFSSEDVPAEARQSAAAMADAIEENYPTAARYAGWIRENPEFIEKNYELVTVWLVDEVNSQEGYFAFLERKD